MRYVGDSRHILILNPDLRVETAAVASLLNATRREEGSAVGAVAPLILDDRGTIYPSLRNDPSLSGAFFDALLGARNASKLHLPSEVNLHLKSYAEPHKVDWASGAALLIPTAVAVVVGPWNETFFLYSEEVDYLRRIRALNLKVMFEPTAVVRHSGGGSGTSMDLYALMAVNRVRLIEIYHGRFYSGIFRAIVMIGHSIRAIRKHDRHALRYVCRRRKWPTLFDRNK